MWGCDTCLPSAVCDHWAVSQCASKSRANGPAKNKLAAILFQQIQNSQAPSPPALGQCPASFSLTVGRPARVAWASGVCVCVGWGVKLQLACEWEGFQTLLNAAYISRALGLKKGGGGVRQRWCKQQLESVLREGR